MNVTASLNVCRFPFFTHLGDRKVIECKNGWSPIHFGGRAAVVLLQCLGGIRLSGLGGLAGRLVHRPPTFPRVGRPFHPNPHPRRRLTTISSSSGCGWSRLCGVARGLPRRLAAPRVSHLGEELPRELPVARPAARPKI